MDWGENGEYMTQSFGEGDESTLGGLRIAGCVPAHCCWQGSTCTPTQLLIGLELVD
jgi:hypothetical protein